MELKDIEKLSNRDILRRIDKHEQEIGKLKKVISERKQIKWKSEMPLTIFELREIVEDYFGCDISERNRERDPYVNARCVYSYYAAYYTHSSLTVVGRYIKRNHATIIHGRNTFQNLYNFDFDFTLRVEKLVKKLDNLIKKRKKEYTKLLNQTNENTN